MAVRIDITGRVLKIRKIKSPLNPNQKPPVFWYLFEIKEGGKLPSPKNLPSADELQYTVFVNEKQFSAMERELNELSMRVSDPNCILWIRGDLTNNHLTNKYVEGDIGVIAHQVGPLIKKEAVDKREVDEKRSREKASSAEKSC